MKVKMRVSAEFQYVLRFSCVAFHRSIVLYASNVLYAFQSLMKPLPDLVRMNLFLWGLQKNSTYTRKNAYCKKKLTQLANFTTQNDAFVMVLRRNR